MFIAHIPSGYILAVGIVERWRRLTVPPAAVFVAGVLGGLGPDFDLLYFYLMDHRQTHHHKYLSHWPLLWVGLLAVSALWLRLNGRSKSACLGVVVCLASLLHIVLDSVCGDVWWFAPFIDKPYALFTVPAVVTPWWLNFILHWTFAVELAILAWAFRVYRRRARTSPKPLPDSAA